MEEGVCYAVNSATQLYVFPDLNCAEGQAVPSAQNTTREVWNLNEQTNKWYKYQTGISSVNTGTSTTKTIAHIWSNPAWYDTTDSLILLIPSVICVLCFFKLILNMFMGVRR